MQAIDRRAAEEFGIPSLLLMENAGRGVAEIVSEIASSASRPPRNDVIASGAKQSQSILIFCGKGNNGGDGLVAARHLHNRGFHVHVLLLANLDELKNDAAVNFSIVQRMKIPVQTILVEKDLAKIPESLQKSDFVVDALFGIGLRSELEEPFSSAVEAINDSRKKVIAVDIPSGLDADTGQVLGIAVNATATATLGLPKKGLVEREGPLYSGQITVVDIGLPRELLA